MTVSWEEFAARRAEEIIREICPDLRGHGVAILIDSPALPPRYRLRPGVAGFVARWLSFEVSPAWQPWIDSRWRGGFATVVKPPRPENFSEWIALIAHELAHWITWADHWRPMLDAKTFETVSGAIGQVQSGSRPVLDEAQLDSAENELRNHDHAFWRAMAHLRFRARWHRNWLIPIGGTRYGWPRDSWFLQVLYDELREHAIAHRPIGAVIATRPPEKLLVMNARKWDELRTQ